MVQDLERREFVFVDDFAEAEHFLGALFGPSEVFDRPVHEDALESLCLGQIDGAWIQVSSATVDLKAASSSAMASSGVLQPRVLRGRWFIRRATSFSSVWVMPLRSVPLGKNWR